MPPIPLADAAVRRVRPVVTRSAFAVWVVYDLGAAADGPHSHQTPSPRGRREVPVEFEWIIQEA
ncbi:hypothetical protein GCM10010431_73240 [Streptomyces kunmingensis]